MSGNSHEGFAESAGNSEALGGLIRDERMRAQRSQEDLARTIGCSKSQLSLMESGQRAVTLEWARKVERALGVMDGRIVWALQWQSVPAELRARMRKSMEDHRALQARMRRALQKNSLADLRSIVDEAERASGVSASDGRGTAKKKDGSAKKKSEDAKKGNDAEVIPQEAFGRFGRQVPVINRVAAGYPREFTDLDYPASVADEYITCPDVSDPDAFAARVVGNSMEPAYREGDIVVFSPREATKSGTDCFVRLERDNETTFKRVYIEEEGKLIRLQPLNSEYPPRTVPREEVGGMYAAVYVMRRVGVG